MTNIIIDCGGKCGNCCNEVELVSTHKLEDGTVRRFYSDGTSDIYNPGVPLENPTTGGGSGATYDDTAIKERLTKLENKQDKDTTYTAGTGITISPDNVISTNVTSYDDTDLKALAEANQAVNNEQDETIQSLVKVTDLLDSEQASLNDRISALESRPNTGGNDGEVDTDTRNKYTLVKDVRLDTAPKKLSEWGGVAHFNSYILNNAMTVDLPQNDGSSFNNLVLTLPRLSFGIDLNGNTLPREEVFNVTTESGWIYCSDPYAARGHIHVKYKYGVLKMKYDLSSSTKVVDFEFEFFKISKISDDGSALEQDAQEPSLTVPLTIDNVMNGEAFGANFYDEYIISVTMDEPELALHTMDYKLDVSEEVIK